MPSHLRLKTAKVLKTHADKFKLNVALQISIDATELYTVAPHLLAKKPVLYRTIFSQGTCSRISEGPDSLV